jgi:phosphatidylinositol alpha 1,6-mannosyltransferase
VITATPWARHHRAQLDRVDGVPVHRLTADLPYELPVHPRAASAVRPLLRRSGYDVVHVHAGAISPFAFAVAPEVVRSATAMVLTVHSLWGYLTPMFRLLDRPVGWTRWPAILSAVSEVAAGPLRRIAAPDAEVRVLPNGIDPPPGRSIRCPETQAMSWSSR